MTTPQPSRDWNYVRLAGPNAPLVGDATDDELLSHLRDDLDHIATILGDADEKPDPKGLAPIKVLSKWRDEPAKHCNLGSVERAGRRVVAIRAAIDARLLAAARKARDEADHARCRLEVVVAEAKEVASQFADQARQAAEAGERIEQLVRDIELCAASIDLDRAYQRFAEGVRAAEDALGVGVQALPQPEPVPTREAVGHWLATFAGRGGRGFSQALPDCGDALRAGELVARLSKTE